MAKKKTKKVGKKASNYFDPSVTFDPTVKTVDQPTVEAVFTRECRLPDGTFTRVGQKAIVPLDVAHSHASSIAPEPKE